MKRKILRRDFVFQTAIACTACCLISSKAFAALGQDQIQEPIDPKKLNYCGYICPADCAMLAATKANDPRLKEQAYHQWRLKERYSIAFDPETIFCYGCKNSDQPAGVVIQKCTVRKCTISKGLDSCIECPELIRCDKLLWTEFPEFREYMLKMREKFLTQSKLIIQSPGITL